MFITYKTLENIISEITNIHSINKNEDCLLELNNYLKEKEKLFVDNRRNKNTSYHFIPISEVIEIAKPILEPPFKYPGNKGYSQIKNSNIISLDLSKEDRCIVQKLLFDIIGKHHWGICKIFVLNIYPNHCPEAFIDMMYFTNRRGNKPLLGSRDGFFYLLEGINSDQLLLGNRNKRKWIKSINKYYKGN